MEYLEEEERITTSFKIFTDDFETILSKQYGVTIKIDKDPKPEEQIPYFNRYISDSFNFRINGDIKLIPVFDKKDVNEEAVWLYYSFSCKYQIRTASIHNAIMMDMFDDQKNLLIFKWNEFEKGYQFRKGKEDVIITFDF